MNERARRLLAVQRTQLDRLTDAQTRKLIDLLKRTRNALRDALDLASGVSAALPLSAPAASVMMAQVDAAIASLQQRMGETYGEMATAAYDLAANHFAQQLTTFSVAAGTTPPPLQIEAVVALQDGILLQHYQRSIQTYGAELASKAQAIVAEGMLQRAPWTLVERRLAGVNGLFAQDYYGQRAGVADGESRRQSRAERIVRTETLSAYNRAHLLDSEWLDARDPGYLKQLVAVHDSRTGEDSLFVDGQVRALDRPFEDNQGRVYMHPPNRPNDREVVVLVRPEWIAAGLTAVDPSDDESRAAVAQAERRIAASRRRGAQIPLTGETTV